VPLLEEGEHLVAVVVITGLEGAGILGVQQCSLGVENEQVRISFHGG